MYNKILNYESFLTFNREFPMKFRVECDKFQQNFKLKKINKQVFNNQVFFLQFKNLLRSYNYFLNYKTFLIIVFIYIFNIKKVYSFKIDDSYFILMKILLVLKIMMNT